MSKAIWAFDSPSRAVRLTIHVLLSTQARPSKKYVPRYVVLTRWPLLPGAIVPLNDSELHLWEGEAMRSALSKAAWGGGPLPWCSGFSNYGVGNGSASSMTITQSKLSGSTNSLSQDGGTARIAFTQPKGPIRKVSGTLQCFDNYDANLAAVTCP
jgi:hypothetical protein